jgi:hypothetical protein
VNRRNFIKRGLLYVPAVPILIPELVRSQTMLTARGLATKKKKSSGGGGGGGGIVLKGHIGALGSANAVTTGAADTTGASLIVIVASCYTAFPTPTDNKSNTYTQINTISQSSYALAMYYCHNPSVGSGHTFTLSATGSYPVISVLWFSGTTGSTYDKLSKAALAGVTSLQPGSLTASGSPALIVAGYDAADTGTASIDSGFTITDQNCCSASGAIRGAGAYLIQSTAAAINPTWSHGSSSATLVMQATFI